MKKVIFLSIVSFLSLTKLAAGQTIDIATGIVNSEGQELVVLIEPGDQYLHKFPLFLFFKMKNPPQMVLWAESIEGEYLDTIFITEKMARQKWLKAPGDSMAADEIRRIESAPVWAWSRGVVEGDGLPMPLKESPMADDITSASPKKSLSFRGSRRPGFRQFNLYLEINHSTDFNDTYRAEIEPGEDNYNGGEFGNGQPSLIYSVSVDMDVDCGENDIPLSLVGRSDPSGLTGELYTDMRGITTAQQIIGWARVAFRPYTED